MLGEKEIGVHEAAFVTSSLLEPVTASAMDLVRFTVPNVNHASGPFRKWLATPIIVICQWTHLTW